ncbi:MAG TPA: helix-turn-helix domain-containing protein [Actinomycetota bacterium]|nr:helix-turn-helix domain-containing protein [Actinomycetota bacterium]
MSDLRRRDVNDPAALRALAHPLRLQLLEQLTVHGPATATTLAARLGHNTGATSYHLRQLERFGFVEEEQGRGRGRERWWRYVPGDVRFAATATPSTELRTAADELMRRQLEQAEQVLARYLRSRDRYRDWDEAALFSNSTMHLTPSELAEFGEALVDLMKAYWRPPEARPPDARPVAAQFYAFPWPDTAEEQ